MECEAFVLHAESFPEFPAEDCPVYGGRGFNLTKTGRQLVRVLKPYILEDTES